MVATKTIVIAGIITAVCVTALVVGIVLGTRSGGCSGDATPPENVTIEHIPLGVLVEWDLPEADEDCDVYYRFAYNYELEGEKVNVTENVTNLDDLSYTIESVPPCVFVMIHIYPVNEDGEESSDHYMGNFTGPLDPVPAPTDIQFTDDEDDLTITWTEPENLGVCSVNYLVTLTKDSGEAPEEPVPAQNKNHTVKQADFCFNFGVSVVTVHSLDNKESAEFTANYQAPGVENIEEETENGELHVSWDPHPKAELCLVSYRVTYMVEGEANPLESISDNSTLKFNTFRYCSPSQLAVTAFVGDSNATTAYKNVSAQDPETISPVEMLNISDDLIVSWTTPVAHRQCPLTYILLFTNDQGFFQQRYTEETEFAVTDSEPFCSFLSVSITTRFSELVSSLPSSIATYRDDSAVEGLDIEATNDHQWLVFWTPHPKHTNCSFQYRVAFTVDGTDDYSSEVSAETETFDKAYCASGNVTVTILDPLGTPMGSATLPVINQDADEPVGISEILFTESTTDLEMTWRSPTSRCGETYNITIRTDINETVEISVSEPTHTVSVGDYCLWVEVDITPILNGRAGNLFSRRYQTGGVEGIRGSIVNKEFVVNWDPHPKEDSCQLNYKVTYTIGEYSYTEESKDPTLTFQEPHYCVASEVTVIAFNADGEETIATTVPIAAINPTTLDDVTDLAITATTLKWKISETYEKCPVTYVLHFESEISSTQYETQKTEFDIPDSFAYCFTFYAQVSVRFSQFVVSSGVISPAYIEELVVDGLKVTEHSTNTDQWEASWTPHLKESICSLQYRVKFSVDGVIQATDDVKSTTYAFDKACADGEITVTVFNSIHVSANFASEPVPYEEPTEAGSVSNIQFTEGTDLTVAWTAPSSKCSLTFKVSTETDNGKVPDETVGTTEYIVDGSSYCFWVNITITPVLGGVEGTPIFEEYATGGVKSIQGEVADRQMVVKWEPHPKAFLCSLSYRVTYTIREGEETKSTSDSTLTIPFYYCAASEVTVTAYNENGATSPTKEVLVSQDPESIDKVDLVISTDRVVTWTMPEVYAKCDLKYAVRLISAIHVTETTTSIPKYIVTDEFPYCFVIDVEVKASLDDIVGNINSISYNEEITVDDLKVTEHPTNTNQWEVSWALPSKHDICSLQYHVELFIDETSENTDDVTSATHTFDKIYCASGEVTVTVFNNERTSTEPVSAPVPYEESTEVGTVSNIEFTEGADLVVSWHPPSSRCNPRYLISIETDLGAQPFIPVDTTHYTIDDISYCLWVKVVVIPVQDSANGEPNSNEYNARPITGLNVVSSTDGDQFTASWNPHPRQTPACSLEYKITYSFEDEIFYTGTTQALTSTFSKEYCAEGEVSVVASSSGASTEPATFPIPAENPTIVEDVRDVAISEGPVTVSWTEISQVGKCVIEYSIRFLPDIGGTQIYDRKATPYVVPDDIYCLSFVVDVQAIVGTGRGSYSPSATYKDGPITGLNVVSSTDGDQFTASWNPHPRQTPACSLEYKITYSFEDEIFYTGTTQALTSTFSKEYCAEGEVSVVASSSGASTEPATFPIPAESPTIVEDVRDVAISEGPVTVSWTEISQVGKCEIEYSIRFLPDIGGPQIYDIKTTPYVVPDDIYCLSFAVDVQAIVGTGRGSYSPSATYKDGPITGLNVVSSTDGDQFTASWNPHPRQTPACSLEYKITYSFEDEIFYTGTTQALTSTFSKKYCAEGEVSVVASSSGASTEPATFPIPAESPTIVEDVRDVAISEDPVTISWTQISQVGKCEIEYSIRFLPDIGGTQIYDRKATPYVVPDDIYCLSFVVDVQAIVGTGISSYSPSATYKDESIIPDLVVSTSTDPNQLIASWNPHLRSGQCGGFTYRVAFSANGYNNEVSDLSDTFPKEYCVDGQVSVTAIAPAFGIESNPAIAKIPEELPTDIGGVIDVSAQDIDGELTLTWKHTPTSGIDKCPVKYHLTFKTDLTEFEGDTDEAKFIVPSPTYCFTFDVKIHPMVEAVIGAEGSYSHRSDFTVELTIQEVGNTIEASWTPHAKVALCGIEYKATYSYDDQTDIPPASTPTPSSAVFDVGYCTSGTVNLIADAKATTALPAQDSQSHSPIMPASVGPVNGVTSASEQLQKVTITWSAPTGLEKCTVTYEVFISPEEAPTWGPSPDTSCMIDELCPTMNIEIVATVGNIPGAPESYQHTCPEHKQ